MCILRSSLFYTTCPQVIKKMIIDTWIKDIDNGKLIGTVFLDLKKAFDLVDHKILLYELKLYHFSPKSVSLFTSYLSNRKQQVKV